MELYHQVAGAVGPVRRDELAKNFDGCDASLTKLLTVLVEKKYLRRVARGAYGPGELSLTAMDRSVKTLWRDKTVAVCARWRGMLDRGTLDEVRDIVEAGGGAVRVRHPDEPTPTEPLMKNPKAEAREIDAVLFYDHEPLDDAVAAALASVGVPAVQIGYPGPLRVDSVNLNDLHAFMALTSALCERGCDELLYLDMDNPTPEALYLRHRRMGVADEARLHGRKLTIIPTFHEALADGLRDHPLRKKLSSAGRKRIGLICAYPAQFPPLLAALGGMNRAINRDVHVASLIYDDNLDQAHSYRGKLAATVSFFPRLIARTAMDRLAARIQGDSAEPLAILVGGISHMTNT